METDAWNAAAHDWAHRVREGMGGRVHAHDASLYALLPPPRGLTLDVGCGEGRLSRELRPAATTSSATTRRRP